MVLHVLLQNKEMQYQGYSYRITVQMYCSRWKGHTDGGNGQRERMSHDRERELRKRGMIEREMQRDWLMQREGCHMARGRKDERQTRSKK